MNRRDLVKYHCAKDVCLCATVNDCNTMRYYDKKVRKLRRFVRPCIICSNLKSSVQHALRQRNINIMAQHRYISTIVACSAASADVTSRE